MTDNRFDFSTILANVDKARELKQKEKQQRELEQLARQTENKKPRRVEDIVFIDKQGDCHAYRFDFITYRDYITTDHISLSELIKRYEKATGWRFYMFVEYDE